MSPSYRPSPSRRSRRALWLYAGLLLFAALAALTWSSAREAWQSSVDRSRGRAIFDLVQANTPTRPTGTPGAVAWLDLQIKRYGRRLKASQQAAYEQLVSVSDDSVPELLNRVHVAMGVKPPEPSAAEELRLLDVDEAVDRGLRGRIEPEDGFHFRTQRFLSYEPAGGAEHILVMTRRRGLDTAMEQDPDSPSNLFLRQAAPYLTRVAEDFDRDPLGIEVGGHRLRLVRIYGVGEDGSFISVPIPPSMSETARLETLRREGQEFRKHPRMPSYVSNEFFFRFDFERPEQQVFYSGLYLDLAGYGLVSTVTRPVVDPSTGFLGVAAIDLAFDIDWRELTAGIEGPQMAHLVELEVPQSPRGWQPWTTLRRALSARSEVGLPLWRALSELADHEQRSGYFVGAGSLFHEVVDGEGALALFQVSHSRWLVVLFPDLPTPLPWGAALLLLILGSSLIAGVELNRRRAESAQIKAENELQEKENLLNSMRVPLTVVDPNSDAVVYGNEAAKALGLKPGRRVGDLVPPGRAREHYERMQRAGVETRRAYGVPLILARESGDEEVRHAVVRSVAVAAPIETLKADERHRLGLFFPLEPEADLAIFAEDLERRCRDDERRRLAGLLAHGVDTLVRVLSYRLHQELAHGSRERAGESAFVRWLASYIERRLAVTGWLLDHWSDAPPLPQETTAEAEQARVTLENFQRVFAWVATEPELRSRLHWNNGVLSQPIGSDVLPAPTAAGQASASRPEVFELRFAWPDGYLFTSPVRGGVGLFLEEVLVNAMRHGKPGSCPLVSVSLDPVRRELCWQVENLVGSTLERDPEDLEPYGGRRMLERLAYLLGWTDLSFVGDQDRFRVSWRVQVSERAAPGEAD